MKISTGTLRYYQKHFGWSDDVVANGVEDLLTKIGTRLGAVEESFDFGSKYAGVLIVKLVGCEKHPNADKLNVCKVDDGGKAQDVQRDENGYVQVVCGAPNVRTGMLAAWLPPGTTVPESVGKEPFILEARELRGIMSNGMLASSRELALGDNHDGILEITLDDDERIDPGTTFIDAYHLGDDFVIDMENKMFTHRPDCFGFIGIARELAGIQHMAFHSPDWYRPDADVPAVEAEPLPLEVRNLIPELVPRFTAITLRDIQVKPSPLWLQIDLAKVGIRSINNVVDYTNYFMLLTGQPIHAYDYDKVAALNEGGGALLVVCHPREGEQITLLNGKTNTPRPEAMMVAAGEHLLCVGGAMGGIETEVSNDTKNIIIEAANWDVYSMRRTAMEHGIFTDAVTRFTKGQSPFQNRLVVAKIVDEIRRFAGGKVASELVDVNNVPEEARQRGTLHPPVSLTAGFVNERLGFQLSADEMKTLLANVEFDVRVDNDNLTVTAPFWRTDIEIPEDVVEEIGRLYGFDRLPLNLPQRSLAPAPKNRTLELKQQLRDILSRAGANEVLSYSFVHGKLLDAAGQDRSQAYQLSNALSPDLQYFRLSLLPSLLERVHPNIKAGHDQFALFETGKVHGKGQLGEDGLPAEFGRLALVFAAEDKAARRGYQGAAYYQARKYLDELLAETGGSFQSIPVAEADFGGHDLLMQMARPFASGRAAVLHNGQYIVGVVGEFGAKTRKALKLPEFSAGFELFLSPFAKAEPAGYRPLPRFPKVEQDLCLKVAADVPYGRVYECVAAGLANMKLEAVDYRLSPVDIYQREDDRAYKRVTIRLAIASHQKTLRDSEVAVILDEVSQVALSALGAERV